MPSKKIRNRDKNRSAQSLGEDAKAPNFNTENKPRTKKEDDYRSRY